MRILVTGNGKSGSWKIRGEQLGHAIGAEVSPKTYQGKIFDTIIVVKRPLMPLYTGSAHVVWDVVDAWPQPTGNTWSREQCMHWLRGQVLAIQPDAIVAATEAMAADCSAFDIPVLALPHHARPGIAVNPIRESVRLVGYEGGEQYIAKWRPEIESECRRRGWTFVVNPEHLADVDIVVALRDQGGYAPRNWKSNVKLANAQASGTPCVVAREAGYLETACGTEVFADSVSELSSAFDALTSYEVRRTASVQLLKATQRLDDIARQYRDWIASL